MRRMMIAVAAGLLCFSMSVAAQNRFSGAIEPGAKFFFGDKTGGSFGTDVVLGILHGGKIFTDLEQDLTCSTWRMSSIIRIFPQTGLG